MLNKNEILKLINNKGLTKSFIYKKLGVTRQTFENWLNNITTPKPEKVFELSGILSTNIEKISDLSLPEDSRNKLKNTFSDNWLKHNRQNSIHLNSEKNILLQTINKLYKRLNDDNLVISAVFNNMDNIQFYIKDKDNSYILANQAYLTNYGFPSEFNISGKQDKDILGQREAVKNHKEDEILLKTKQNLTNLKRPLHGTRKKRIGLINKKILLSETGNVEGLISFKSDITEIETQYKQLQLLHSTLQDSSSFIYVGRKIKEKKFEFFYENGKYEDIWGETKASFENNTDKWLNNIPDELERKRVTKLSSSTEYPKKYIYNYTRPDNGKKVIIEENIVIKDDIVCGIGRDITSQREFMLYNTFLELIANHSSVAQCILDENGNYVAFNKKLQELTGYSHEDFADNKINLDKIVEELIAPEDKWIFKQTLPLNQITSLEYRIKNKFGKYIKLHSYVSKRKIFGKIYRFSTIFNKTDEEKRQKFVDELFFMNTIFEATDTTFKILEEDTGKLVYEKNYESVLGYTLSEVASWNYEYWLNNIVYEEDRKDQLNLLTHNKFPYSKILRIYKKDGTVIKVLCKHVKKEYKGKKYRAILNTPIYD